MGHACPDLGVPGEAVVKGSWGHGSCSASPSEVAHALEVRLQGPQLPEPRSSLSPPRSTLSCSSVHMCTHFWDAQLCVHMCMHAHSCAALPEPGQCVAGEVAEGSTCVCGTHVLVCALTCVRMLLGSCLPMCMSVGIMYACVSRGYVSGDIRNLPGSDTSLDMTCHPKLAQGS